MKTEKYIRSWKEFENEIEKLMHSPKYRSQKPFLFRGQSDTQWSLKTTVERLMGERVEMWKYHLLIDQVKNRIEEFTGKTFLLPDYTEIAQWLVKSEPIFHKFPGYEYMVYLRHHGFPSPLLDWSMSPFVAAYFAFRDLPNNVKSVAIFAYLEKTQGKSLADTDPYIARLTPNIQSDRRHFLQQSTYTICIAGKNQYRY